MAQLFHSPIKQKLTLLPCLLHLPSSPDPTNRESSPASSRSYSRSCSGSASPPLTGSGRPSMEGYNHSMSHSQHLPTPPSGLHHSTTSSNSSVNLPSLSRLLAETGQHGQQQHQSGGHQSAPNSHRPSLDGPTGTWSPPVGDAEQEAAYALARRAGKLPEGQAYVSHPQYPSHSQRTISRRGSVPSLFGTGGVGHHSSNVRGGESGSASGESSPMSSSHTKSGEDPSDYYSNPNGAGRPMPPLKRERDISDGDLKPPGVNIPGVSSHHASNLVDDRERRGRSGPDAEGLRFGVSPRSRADVDAGFARGRPYSSLRDSETNPLFNNGRYSPGPGPMPAGTGAGAQTLERPPGVATKGPGSRSHSQLPPSLGSTDHHSRQPAPSSRSSSTGRVPGGGNSETRASSLSRIDSSSNHSSPRGSPFASPRGSPSRTMEPLPQHHHHHPHPHHHLHSQVNPQHPHAFHPYSSPNHSPLLNARDGLPVGGHPHLPLSSLHLHHQPASIAHHSAAAALDVLGAAASERLKDEGLTSRSTVPSTLAPSNTASNTSSPLNPHPNGPTHHPLTAPTSPQQPSEQLRGRSLQASWAIHEGSVYWARRANAEGPAICAYHQTHNNTSSDDPAESMDLDPPAHGAQPQLRYLDCGCSPDEVLFEIACERKGIKGLDPKSRRNLLSLERKRNGYKEGDWEE